MILLAQGVACWVLRSTGLTSGSQAMLWMLVFQNTGWVVLHTLAIVNGVKTPMAWLQVGMAVVVGGWSAVLLRQTTSVTV
ncbi:hypothetical protein ACFSUS_09950 [Spirosoma soli]|uniref:Uncharacterized protein n=1 Tax=Spirosoma soli TaxID=1770529 RepID=A0ABW5M3S1_9BACT